MVTVAMDAIALGRSATEDVLGKMSSDQINDLASGAIEPDAQCISGASYRIFVKRF